MKKYLLSLMIVFASSASVLADQKREIENLAICRCRCSPIIFDNEFEKDDEVYDIIIGKGKVVKIDTNPRISYQVICEFIVNGNKQTRSYTRDGRYYKEHTVPSLYHNKMKIVEDDKIEQVVCEKTKLEDLVGKFIYRTSPGWNSGGDNSYKRIGLKLIAVTHTTFTLYDTKDRDKEIILLRSTWDDGYWEEL